MPRKGYRKKEDGKKEKIGDKNSNEENENEDGKCAFCLSSEDNERNFGKMFRKCGYTVHNFCMLFSSALNQRGKSDRHGIMGFLMDDIKKELKRGVKLKCCYCKKGGATIGCAVRKCGKKFHLPCGLENETLNQFFGSFCVFCSDHRPQQKFPKIPADSNTSCPICLCSVEPKISFHTLRTPCCKNAWFHRSCVQDQALNAGYFFKCPLCNNKEEYQLEMRTQGIYIPEQDASWEMDPNAFQDLLHRHDQCDMPTCICPDGRSHDFEGRWEIILCAVCGHQGCHITCGRLSFYKPYWECSLCQGILNTKNPVKQSKKAGKKKSDEMEASSSELFALPEAPSPETAKETTCLHILQKIQELQEALQGNYKPPENVSSDEEITGNGNSKALQTSTDNSHLISERISSYISDSDDDVDIVALRYPAGDAISRDSTCCSDTDVDVVGDNSLRLSPSDFPSPDNIKLRKKPTKSARKLAMRKKNLNQCGGYNTENEPGFLRSSPTTSETYNDQHATKVGEPCDHPQITCYILRESVGFPVPNAASFSSKFSPTKTPEKNHDSSSSSAQTLDVPDIASCIDLQSQNTVEACEPTFPGITTQVFRPTSAFFMEKPASCITLNPPCSRQIQTGMVRWEQPTDRLASDKGSPAALESVEMNAEINSDIDVCEEVSCTFSNACLIPDGQVASYVELHESYTEHIDNAANVKTYVAVSELEVGSSVSNLERNAERDTDTDSDSVVCLSPVRFTKQEPGIVDPGQDNFPLETSKENCEGIMKKKKVKKSKKRKRNRDDSRKEKKRKRHRNSCDAEGHKRRKHRSKHGHSPRCLTSLEVGEGNMPPECPAPSEVSVAARTEVANERMANGVPCYWNSVDAAKAMNPMCSYDQSEARALVSVESAVETDSDVEIVNDL